MGLASGCAGGLYIRGGESFLKRYASPLTSENTAEDQIEGEKSVSFSSNKETFSQTSVHIAIILRLPGVLKSSSMGLPALEQTDSGR